MHETTYVDQWSHNDIFWGLKALCASIPTKQFIFQTTNLKQKLLTQLKTIHFQNNGPVRVKLKEPPDITFN
jgi:hypothetical protein